MLVPALADCAATFADTGAETRSGVFEDGNGCKKDAGEERDQECEKQDRAIDADLPDARKSRRGDRGEDAQRCVSKAQTDGAADQSENDTFEQKIGGDASAARAQGGAHGQFLTTAFDAHEQQIGDIGAGNQKDHADGAHQNPEDAADVADDIALERADVGADVRIFEELEAEARRGWERAHDNGKHARDIAVGLFEGYARLKSGESFMAEVAEVAFVAVQFEGHDQGRIFPIQNMKFLQQDTKDLPGCSVYDHASADRGGVAAKLPAPIPIGEHHGFWSARRIILLGKGSIEYRRKDQQWKRSIAVCQTLYVH